MIYIHNLSPVFLDLGLFKIHWYGIMYLMGFTASYWLCYYRRDRLGWTKDDLSDALFYCALGVIIGGRLGYILFYDTASIINNPISIFQIWKGGMSFHGGVIGVIIAFLLLAKKKGVNPVDLSDYIMVPGPIGLGLGRLGNFINGELWGKPTDGSWGVIFPQGGLQPRHPSQLYEMLLEGVLLFIILWIFTMKPRPRMIASGIFLLGYGSARFIVEFVRIPDSHLGYLLFDWMTMGQILSLPMIIIGIAMIAVGYSRNIIPNYSAGGGKVKENLDDNSDRNNDASN